MICRHCQARAPVTIPDGWHVTALCPACVEVKRVKLDRQAEVARRLLSGDESAVEEYLELLEGSI